MYKVYVIYILIIPNIFFFSSCFSTIFSNIPTTTFSTTSSIATQIKISPLGDKIVVGFNNGNIQIYTIQGNWCYNFYGHYNKIIDIEWEQTTGLITLDQIGKAIVWSNTGDQKKVWEFKQNVYDMAVSTQTIAFSFAYRIEEYYTYSYVQKMTYLPYTGYEFRKIMFSQFDNIIYATYNNSYAQLFSTFTGKPEKSLINVYGNINSLQSKASQDKVVALASNKHLLQITSNSTINYFGQYTSSSLLSICSNKKAILLSQKQFHNIDIYDYSGIFQQSLSYFPSILTAMDCQKNILVTVDTNGYVTINSGYIAQDSIIGVIFSGLIFILMIGAAIKIIKQNNNKKNNNQSISANNYQSINDNNNMNINRSIQPTYPYQTYGINQGYNHNNNNNINNNTNFNNINNNTSFNNYPHNPNLNNITNPLLNGYLNNPNPQIIVIANLNNNNPVNNPYNEQQQQNPSTTNNIIVNQEQSNPYATNKINPYVTNKVKNYK